LRVAVTFVTKLHGEAHHKLHISLHFLNADDVSLMLEVARGRFRNHDPSLPTSDLYVILDGGRGILNGLTPLFRGQQTTAHHLRGR
jgi:excinuclease UvrABC nuclease subunit